jgi:disulfide bond formation protein DsbB
MRAIPVAAAVFILSVLVIGGALFFEFVIGLVPCELCLLQRWPWYAAIVLSGLMLALRRPGLDRPAALIFALLFLVSTGFAVYHVGVEQHVFAGPTACTAPSLAGKSAAELLKLLQATPVVRCDEPQWELFGVSLAGWNLVASLLLLALCVLGWRRGAAMRAVA